MVLFPISTVRTVCFVQKFLTILRIVISILSFPMITCRFKWFECLPKSSISFLQVWTIISSADKVCLYGSRMVIGGVILRLNNSCLVLVHHLLVLIVSCNFASDSWSFLSWFLLVARSVVNSFHRRLSSDFYSARCFCNRSICKIFTLRECSSFFMVSVFLASWVFCFIIGRHFDFVFGLQYALWLVWHCFYKCIRLACYLPHTQHYCNYQPLLDHHPVVHHQVYKHSAPAHHHAFHHNSAPVHHHPHTQHLPRSIIMFTITIRVWSTIYHVIICSVSIITFTFTFWFLSTIHYVSICFLFIITFTFWFIITSPSGSGPPSIMSVSVSC